MDKLFIKDIDDLKKLLSTIKATPTPGYCSSFGLHWYTVNYRNENIIIFISTNHKDNSFKLRIYEKEYKESDNDILTFMNDIYINKKYKEDGIVKDNSWSCPNGFTPMLKEEKNKIKDKLGPEVSNIIGFV